MTRFELVVSGPKAGQTWRRALPLGRTVRLGRDPTKAEWTVAWDLQVSRKHCDLLFDGERLHVLCFPEAPNPTYVKGQAIREFTLNPGERFRIGDTKFRFERQIEPVEEVAVVDGEPPAPISSQCEIPAAHEPRRQVAEAVLPPARDEGSSSAWSRLPEPLRERVRQIAAGEVPSDEDQRQILTALKAYPEGEKLLAARRTTTSVTRHVLRYLSRGETWGEFDVLSNRVHDATYMAHDDTQLVRIPAEAFAELRSTSPQLGANLAHLTGHALRHNSQPVVKSEWQEKATLQSLPEFVSLGLDQGLSLLLIDLDRCTRCGDCVRACIATHDDGYSRLFLDGPRFERFLVPAACRSCLDPVCQIGCPVGAIGRGPTGDIQIHDWCLGCGLCAEQCPYEAIQLHAIEPNPKLPKSPAEPLPFASQRAVACDLCVNRPGGEPACVTECPHAAAIRVKACQ